jgi:hypothetical protein
MTRDLLVLAVLVLTFAVLATAHGTLAVGLLRRNPRWRGPVALLIPPLAPIWGWRAGMRVRGVVWVTAAIAYGVALCLAQR